MISVTGPLKIWSNEEGRMHFMSVSEGLSVEIRAHSMLVRRGFGSVRVEVTVKDFTWRTSLFPSKESGGFFLPIKMEVLRKTGIAAGDQVTADLELL